MRSVAATAIFPPLNQVRLAIIGLGYVGLPLAVTFGTRYSVVGFDSQSARIAELSSGCDHTLEVTSEQLDSAARHLHFTDQIADLNDCTVYIVAVPTPVDRYKRPDLQPLLTATATVAQVLKSGDVVIYESTVYPGATEEECVPVLEAQSGLTFNRDFFVGYSPERINPGDPEHRLSNICKITSGSTPASADFIDALYASVIAAGTHKAPSIKVAEAAKVIENTQRDVNIALVNELALIFNRLDIDTEAVLKAAATKWNFLPFKPGLVGGHCIGVDPYYLTHKAQSVGYHPEVILAGRRINDGMGAYVATQVIKLMTRRHIPMADSKILLLGLTFKENCPDLRNTRAIDIVETLGEYHANVEVYDPWVDHSAAQREYSIRLVDYPRAEYYDAIIIAVAHHQFSKLGASAIRAFGKPGAVMFDVKHLFPIDQVDGRL